MKQLERAPRKRSFEFMVEAAYSGHEKWVFEFEMWQACGLDMSIHRIQNRRHVHVLDKPDHHALAHMQSISPIDRVKAMNSADHILLIQIPS